MINISIPDSNSQFRVVMNGMTTQIEESTSDLDIDQILCIIFRLLEAQGFQESTILSGFSNFNKNNQL